MIYELRTYECAPGRLPDLIKRFQDHTLALFDKHGIRHGEFYTVAGEKDQLVYFLNWDDMKEREAKFPQFLKDIEWIRVRNESDRLGPLTKRVTSQFLQTFTFPAK